jgi:hypothetical protein
MKSHGRDSAGTGVELSIAETFTPAFQVFTGQFQGMQYSSLHSGNFVKGAAQPWLRLGIDSGLRHLDGFSHISVQLIH